jgi:hypothetical protein
MATYTFRFDEVAMNQVWFEAANEEEAKELLRKCEADEMNISDLPKVQERNRGIQVDFSVSVIEED